MAARTVPLDTLPSILTTVWVSSRKVTMPTSSPSSMTTSETRSRSFIRLSADMRDSSGPAVNKVPPLIRKISLTFMVFLCLKNGLTRVGRFGCNIAHNLSDSHHDLHQDTQI